jgi:threonine synthase
VTTAAAVALARSGRFTPSDEVVLCITGNGLKTPDAVAGVLDDIPLVEPRVREIVALTNRE